MSCFPHPVQIFTVKYIFLVVCKITGRTQLSRNRLVITRGRKNSDSIPLLKFRICRNGWMALETDRNRQGMNRMFRCPSHTRRGVPAGVQIYMIKNVSSYFFFLWGAPNLYTEAMPIKSRLLYINRHSQITGTREMSLFWLSVHGSIVTPDWLRTGPHHHR